MPEYTHAARVFSGQGRFRGTMTLRQTFRKKHKKKMSHRETILEFFLLDTIKTTFGIENFIQSSTHSGPFFSQNYGTFFDLKKKAREIFPTPT